MAGCALMVLLIFAPMAAAAVSAAAWRGGRAPGRRVSCTTVLLVLAAAVCGMARLLLCGGWEWRLPGLCGLGLHFMVDGFRALFALVAALLWAVSTLYSGEYFGDGPGMARYHGFSLLTLGAVMGVFLSADLLTTFLFFEVMSLTSYPLVIHDGAPRSMRAGETYLAVAVIGGLAMLMGMFLLDRRFDSLEYARLYQAAGAMSDKSALYLPGALLIVGFGAKAGMFPLHIWLPKAHPVAPAPASALLSGILTKTGVFGVLAVGSSLFAGDLAWGLGLLLPGVVTMVWGAVLALLSVDLKRTLACSSVSQIGFVLVGVSMQHLLGEHGALAVRGTILHMLNHSLLKLVLFLLAGVVYCNLHRLDLNDIRGFGRGKPLLLLLFLMGALGLGGVPLWNGYLSKTLLHESIVEAVHVFHGRPLEGWLRGTEALFLFTGGMTVAYLLKLFVALFLDKPETPAQARGRYLSRGNAVLLAGCALLLPLLGTVTPLAESLAALGEDFVHGHPPEHAVHFFAWVNLRGAVISLAVGVLLYLLVVRRLLMRGGRYVNRLPSWLDLEERVYRPALQGMLAACTFLARIAETLPAALIRRVLTTVLRQRRPNAGVPKFYYRFYWLFYPQKGQSSPEPVYTGTLTWSLLLFGAGVSVVFVYIFLYAVRAAG